MWLIVQQSQDLEELIQCHAFKRLHTKAHDFACLHNSICCTILQAETAFKDNLELRTLVEFEADISLSEHGLLLHLTHSINE